MGTCVQQQANKPGSRQKQRRGDTRIMNQMPDSKDRDPVTSEEEQDQPELDPRIQSAIGRALQAHYDDLIREPIPDRFLVLLAELEAKEQRHGE